MKLFFSLILFTVLTSQCSKNSTESVKVNKFNDSIIVKIHELKDHRNSIVLIKFLESDNKIYVKEAALALGSVGDPKAVNALKNAYYSFDFYSEENEMIQKQIGFALAQSMTKMSAIEFDSLYNASLQNEAREMIMWAFGRHGDTYADRLLWKAYQDYATDAAYKIGMLKGFFEFAARKHWSPKMMEYAMELAKPAENQTQRIWASAYLARLTRINDIEIETTYLDNNGGIRTKLIELLANEKDPLVKMNLALATKPFSRPDKVNRILAELQSENDYRVKVAMIQALDDRDYETVKDVIASFIGTENEHIETAAAKYFATQGSIKDSLLYKELLPKCSFWGAKNQMVSARIRHRFTDNKNYDFYYEAIKDAPNKWARGELYKIGALKSELYGRLLNYYQYEVDPTAKTQCIEAIDQLTDKYHDYLMQDDPKWKYLKSRFLSYLIDELSTDDGYRVYTVAGILQKESYGFKGNAKYISLIDSLLQVWTLPVYYETHLELAKLRQLCKIGEVNLKSIPIEYNNPTNWGWVKSLKPNQKLKMTTEKGEIIIELDVENAPSTVAYIAKLANEGFYDGLIWHRVVSNFVIQGGDPFGNGTGSAPGTLRSEHSINEYREGAVGIASAGKDTESCQFFITHNPTPHLNGRYTIIGYVVEGLDVVHQIQVNDKILKVELL
jgi:cyclophilin family peptidyl-prolyl cis-trans isomerase